MHEKRETKIRVGWLQIAGHIDLVWHQHTKHKTWMEITKKKRKKIEIVDIETFTSTTPHCRCVYYFTQHIQCVNGTLLLKLLLLLHQSNQTRDQVE